MRELRIVFLGLLGLVLFPASPYLAAQETNKPVTPELHCLWKAQGNSNVVYFLGAVHLLRDKDYPLPRAMESAFADSRIAAFEVDIDKASDPETGMAILEKAKLPPGKSLQQVLPLNVYTTFTNHVREMELPVEMFDSMKPGIAVITLETIELQKAKGADPEYGVDRHFFTLARQSHRQIIPFETVDFEINLLLSFSGSDEELMVEKSLEQIDGEMKLYNEILTAWKKGDAPGLEKMLNEMRTEAPTIFKRLVTDRTASWMPQIERLLHGTQNAIVIVGAGHLVGPDGIIELLKKRGVKVTQL